MKIFGFETNVTSEEKISQMRDMIFYLMGHERLNIDKVERLITMYLQDKISAAQIYSYATTQGTERVKSKNELFQRLDEWKERFGMYSDEDMEYFHRQAVTMDYNGKFNDIEGIIDYISHRVMGQDEAIRKIVTAVWLHCESVRNNLNIKVPAQLLIGNSGVGKTYILNMLSDILHCPIVRINASITTAPGYKGGDSVVEQIFSQLSNLEGEYPNISETPIIIMVNEIDKSVRGNQDGYRVELMSSFMGLIEKNKLYKVNPLNGQTLTIDLKKSLVLFDGCFDKIEQNVARRLNVSHRIGFENSSNELSRNELRQKVTGDDLVSYGMLTEFVSRIQSIICLNDMTYEILYDILDKGCESPVKGYVEAFKKYGHELKFTPEAMSSMANLALARNLGARSLESIVNSVMQPYITLLKSKTPQKIVITDEVVARAINPNANYK